MCFDIWEKDDSWSACISGRCIGTCKYVVASKLGGCLAIQVIEIISILKFSSIIFAGLCTDPFFYSHNFLTKTTAFCLFFSPPLICVYCCCSRSPLKTGLQSLGYSLLPDSDLFLGCVWQGIAWEGGFKGDSQATLLHHSCNLQLYLVYTTRVHVCYH